MDAWPVWNYENGQSIRVVCYTNAPQARLELNHRIVGETKTFDDRTGILSWDIPYEKGTLEAVGQDSSGNEICRYAIRTSERPYALVVEETVKELSKNKATARIVLRVVDQNGTPVMLSDDEITCSLQGPARLLGLESGNNQDMSDYTDPTHRAYHGRLVAYIQTQGQDGTVTLHFTSPWLKSAGTEISVK
jgi:hypothetical protein